MSEKTHIDDSKDKQIQFIALYGPNHTRLSRFCRAISRDNEEAKDLLSETALRAYENFGTLRKPESFVYYLFGMASRLHRKKTRRLKFRGVFSQEQAENIIDRSARPDDSLELQLLFETMQKLPIEQCEALTLFEISGFSLIEISELQHCGLSAVKARISRARLKLGQMLNVNDEIVKTLEHRDTKAIENLKATFVNFF